MPEFDNILPEEIGELEPNGFILVRRLRKVESSTEGIFNIERGETFTFGDLKHALEWASHSPQDMHEFVFPMAGTHLAGSLNYDPEKDAEVVMLTSGQRMGISPKSIDSAYRIYTDGKTLFHIIFYPDNYQKNVFREDSVFISLPSIGTTPVLHFTFNSGEHSSDELALGTARILKKITFISDKLLTGYFDNP